MDELRIFKNQEFWEVRARVVDGVPWFCFADVCDALSVSTSSHVLDENERIMFDSDCEGDSALFVNESGLYSLMFSAKTERAKKFCLWITGEVLPELCETGVYESSPILARELTTDDYMEAARTVSRCRSDRLPIVLDLYRKAGFDIPKLPKSDRDELVDRVVELLSRQSLRKSEKILGISRAVLGRYRNRIYKPSVERCRFIIEKLGDSHV